jgi:hypothetical protein
MGVLQNRGKPSGLAIWKIGDTIIVGAEIVLPISVSA